MFVRRSSATNSEPTGPGAALCSAGEDVHRVGPSDCLRESPVPIPDCHLAIGAEEWTIQGRE
jgi:hypothetical protein